MCTTTPRMRSRRPGGYTLIEVLLTVAILGLIGAAVVPSMLNAGSLGVQAAARVIVSDLLYAQNEAIAQQLTRGVVFDVASDSYRLTDEFDNTLTAPWINGQANNYRIDFTTDRRFKDVTITAVDFNGGNVIEYDSLGTPSTGGSVTIQFDRRSFRIDVASFTGRVTVTQES